ncbi:hypothetical protein BpHYR1_051422 [Brachionus plicatilis]|uniref:Uncharacterized protein n=1 Tax=Brachionus plicatilis TaxID=10195 RepID=A0A3M7R9Q7_BRAPC|nr:hypothetical protein BpHYR1_051422 [Brachionus plicatilis]
MIKGKYFKEGKTLLNPISVSLSCSNGLFVAKGLKISASYVLKFLLLLLMMIKIMLNRFIANLENKKIVSKKFNFKKK